MASADNQPDAPSPEESEALSRQWQEWAQHDLDHFLGPLCAGTGLTRQEALLYLISERLAQIAEVGVTVRLFARHDVVERRPPEDDEEWKK